LGLRTQGSEIDHANCTLIIVFIKIAKTRFFLSFGGGAGEMAIKGQSEWYLGLWVYGFEIGHANSH